MNDIDFDELDKAVSSLIGKPNASAPAASSEKKPATSPSQSGMPEPVTPAIPPKPASSAEPVLKPPVSPPVTPSRPTATISPLPASPAAARPKPLAVRRTGRVMDVLHPSAVAAASPAPAATAGSAVVPPKPANPSTVSTTGKKLKPLAPMTTNPPVHDDEPLLAASTHSHPEVSAKKNEEKESPQTPDLSPPLFLSGTKVEKRPLGAFSGAKPADDSISSKAPSLSEKDQGDDEKPKSDAATKTSLPPEFDQRVVEVEAGDIAATDEDNRPDTPPAYPPEPQSITPSPSKSQNRPPVQQVAHAAAQSIPAQYKAKQPEPDLTPRPIFDTDQYHHPVKQTHPKKAHKPWLWVVIVLLLLAAGAGLGIGAYFLVN